MDPHVHGKLILTRAQKQFNGQRTVFSTNGPGKVEHPCAKRKKYQLTNTSDLMQKLTHHRA